MHACLCGQREQIRVRRGDKVLDIENQGAKGLRENAGKKVTVRAEVSKDGTSIKISDLKPAK